MLGCLREKGMAPPDAVYGYVGKLAHARDGPSCLMVQISHNSCSLLPEKGFLKLLSTDRFLLLFKDDYSKGYEDQGS